MAPANLPGRTTGSNEGKVFTLLAEARRLWG